MGRFFTIASTPIDIPTLTAGLADPRAGALAAFEGRVRNHNEGDNVLGLDYEVFAPLAQTEGEKILDEAIARFGVHAVHAVHRQGTLLIGDCAVWVGAIASHRDEAFKACRYVIDELKHRLPIWKKERYVDGRAEWVNCQHTGPDYGHHDHAHGDGSHRHHAHDHHAPAVSEADFYDRQTRLPEIGADGQAKLKVARVLIVGAGGLGSPASLMLAAAGVGTIGIAEFDTLEASNLHRQILYSAADIGQSKASLASRRLKDANPFVTINVHPERVDAGTAPALIAGYDLVLDCTDNFTTKYLLGDAAILYGVPVIQASIHRYEGQLLTIDRDSEGGCLRCLWPAPPPEGMIGNCAEVGVLGVVPGLFGTLQATEALKRLLGLPGTLDRHLLIFDALSLESRRIARHKDADCPLCGVNPSIRNLQKSARPPTELEIDAMELTSGALAQYRIVDVREADERAALPLPGTLHVPFSAFDPAGLPVGPEDSVLLVCASGTRSLRASDQLRALGWKNVRSIIGGARSLRGLLLQAAE